MTEYIALGSKRRTEANETYRTLTNPKNIPDFARYLTIDGLASQTINNYCVAIRNLINDGHFSHNRNIFLAFDTVSEYPNAIKQFMDIPEIKQINDVWHNTYSAALRKYIDFLMEMFNVNPQETQVVVDELQTQKIVDADTYFQSEKLDGFTNHLQCQDLNERSVYTYVHAIKKLINEDYFSRYNYIFLSCQSLTDFQNAIDKFIAIPEVNTLNLSWKYVFSAALAHFAQFLFNNNEVPVIEKDNHFQIDDTPIENTDVDEPTENETDWEAVFTNTQGKLTRIANPELIDKLRPVLDTEYKSTATAYNIVEDFYGDRFKKMEIKDWQKLFDNIDWNAPYYSPSTVAEPDGKRKTHILKVVLPNGVEIMEKRVSETLVKVVQYAGAENVRLLNISACGANMIVEESEINQRYETATKFIENGLYVNTCSDTPTKYAIIQQISDSLGLGLNVEFIPIDDNHSPQAPVLPNPTLSTREKVKVTFPNGRVIQYAKVLQTLIDVIEYAGTEKVKELNIPINRSNLITDTVTPPYEISLKPLSNGMYVHTNSSTQTKFAQIQQISNDLHRGLIVELV